MVRLDGEAIEETAMANVFCAVELEAAYQRLFANQNGKDRAGFALTRERFIRDWRAKSIVSFYSKKGG
jgi:hypothetical protein